ncbi:MAG: CDP-alcohol phosphatidyltransferase family protein [Nitrospinales bacterium]
MNAPEISSPEPEGLVEPINKFFHVPIAARIVTILKNTPVTPNQVTYSSVLFGLASALAFCQGDIWWIVIAGVFLEISLILDCADGQLARAKNCATDFGRLLDGIGGYVAYLSMIGGMMFAFNDQIYTLVAITIITVLKAISFDYLKLSISTVILEGIDGSKRDIQKAFEAINKTTSPLLTIYFYYLQFQQFIFKGQWVPIKEYSYINENHPSESKLTEEQRKFYYKQIKPLLVVWQWNGHELILFLIAIFSIFGVIEESLILLAVFATLQFCLTFLFHHYIIRNEASS